MKWIDKGWSTCFLVNEDGEILAEIFESMTGFCWTDAKSNKRYIDKISAQKNVESEWVKE